MTLAVLTAATFLACNLAGFVASTWIERHGLPAEASAQVVPRRAGAFAERLPLIAVNLTMMTLGTLLLVPLVAPVFVTGWPGLARIVVDFALVLLIDDLVFYAVHRAMHRNAWLYGKLHALHHESYAPVPLEYLYVHPGELAAGASGVVFGVACVWLLFGNVSFLAFLAYVIVRNLHELDIHSGLRSRLAHALPLLAPNEHHDLHHHMPGRGNYASMLTLWDHLLGTHADDAQVRGRLRDRLAARRAA